MRRFILALSLVLSASVTTEALGTNRFPFRPFDDVTRPKAADEVRISYQMLVSRRNGIDELEAKLIALFEMVERQVDHGYDLAKPRVSADSDQWQVHIPSKFSINDGRRPPDFIVCVDKVKGKITCFAPEAEIR